MNKRERIISVLDHKEPDRVPITELAIDPVHIEAISGMKLTDDSAHMIPSRVRESSVIDTTFRTYEKLGFELIACELSAADGWSSKPNPDKTINDEWGRVLSYDPTARVWVQTSSIFNSPEDFERFSFPDPYASGRTYAIERMKSKAGDEMAVAALIRDPFATAWEMFKITDFVRWLYEKPDFIRHVLDEITEFNIEVVKRVIDAQVDLIVGDGDYSEKRGPLVPVKFFKEVILPNLRKQVQVVHKAGLKFIKHTDGNINLILADLADIVDGLHSLDPTAGMDIGKVKRLHGDKLILMGNVSVDNLCTMTTGEIMNETRECLRKAAPGGGYVLTSSNSWYADAKLENCLAMVQTGRKYGSYPICA